MTMWNPRRSPDDYPQAFRQALRCIGQHIIALETSEDAAKREQRRWRAFMASCRNFPAHESGQALEVVDARSFREQSPIDLRWEVWVTTSDKLSKTF